MEFEQDHHVAAVLDQAFGLLDHHLGDLDVAHRRFVEGRGNHLALHRALHVGDFFRPLVDQQHDQIAFRMIVRDRVGDVLQQYGLAGARRRHDQRALTLADRRHNVDDARRKILFGRIFVFHLQPLVGIERRQVVEVDLVARFFRVFEIERIDLEQREVAFAFLGAADVSVDGVTGAQSEPADLRGRNVDVVRAGEIVGFRRAQKAETVRQYFDDTLADNVGLAGGELFENAEHQFLFAHGRSVLDFELFGKGNEFGWSSWFLVLGVSFPAWGCPTEIRPAVRREKSVAGEERESRRSTGSGGFTPRSRCISRLRFLWSQNANASAYVRWDGANIRKDGTSGKRRNGICLKNALRSERFQHHQEDDQDHNRSRYLIDNSIEFL